MKLRVLKLKYAELNVTPEDKTELKKAITEGRKRGDKAGGMYPAELNAAEIKLRALDNAEEAIRQALRDPIDRLTLDKAIGDAEKLHYKAEKLDVAKDERDRLQAVHKLAHALQKDKSTAAWKEAIEEAIEEATAIQPPRSPTPDPVEFGRRCRQFNPAQMDEIMILSSN